VEKLTLNYVEPPGGAWEKPACIRDATPVEPFPLDALPAPMRHMADAVARSMPCPPDMPAATMLAAASAAIGTTRRLKIKSSWYEQCQLWIAVVARPGSKKSPAASCVLAPVRRAERRLRKEYETSLANYKAELTAWERQAKDAAAAGQPIPKAPVEPTERQLIVGDTTREALCDLLHENPRGVLVQRDKLTGWVKSLNQYRAGKGDYKQFWLSLWSAEPVTVNRRGRRLRVDNPFASVTGNVPPAVLGELTDSQTHEDGWLHRILFAWPDPIETPYTPDEPDPLTLDEYEGLFVKLFALQPARNSDGEDFPRTLRFTPQAQQRFADFVTQNSREINADDFPDELRGPWAKMDGCVARIALVLHVCRHVCGETQTEDVDGESVEKAILTIRYFQAHARRVYPQLLHDEADDLRQDAETVLGWIRRNKNRIRPAGDDGKPAMAFSWNMIRRDMARRFEGREDALRKALEALEARSYVKEFLRERKGSSGRKPKPDYLVNPSVFSAERADLQAGECP
jgi:hypothetical protein